MGIFRRKKDKKEDDRAESAKINFLNQMKEDYERMQKGEDLGKEVSVERNGERYWLMKNGKWKKEKDSIKDPGGYIEDQMNKMSLKDVQNELQKYLHPFVIDD